MKLFFCLTLFIAYLSDLTFFLIHFSFSTAWQVSGTSERPHGIHRFIKGQPHADDRSPRPAWHGTKYIAFSLPNSTSRLDDVIRSSMMPKRLGTVQGTEQQQFDSSRFINLDIINAR